LREQKQNHRQFFLTGLRSFQILTVCQMIAHGRMPAGRFEPSETVIGGVAARSDEGVAKCQISMR
jgi:hypothetical protein